MGHDYYKTKDGKTHSNENPHTTDSSGPPTLPCLFCGWLLILVWPMPLLILVSFVPKFFPDSDTFEDSFMYYMILLVIIVICLVTGGFIGRRLLREVCSKEARATLEERGLSAVQRALDWWWGRHPYALICSIAILSGGAAGFFTIAGADAFTAWLGFDFLELVIVWSSNCLTWLVACLGICAITGLWVKAPGD